MCLTAKAPNTKQWVNELELEEIQQLLTNANDFLNLDTGGIDLFGELTDGLVRVLVGEGVNIYPHT